MKTITIGGVRSHASVPHCPIKSRAARTSLRHPGAQASSAHAHACLQSVTSSPVLAGTGTRRACVSAGIVLEDVRGGGLIACVRMP